MLNRIDLVGRLVRDPEYRALNDGTSLCNFTLAVEDDYKDKDGNKVTDFVDCTAWRKSAEYIVKYQRKGALVAVCGRLKSRKWTDKDGNKRTSWFVSVENAYGLGSKQEAQAGENSCSTGGWQTPAAAYQPTMDPGAEYPELTDDDPKLPF